MYLGISGFSLLVVSCATETGGGVTAAKEYYDLGLLYESQKDGLARAVEMYTKAIAIDPTMRNARYNLAHAQVLQGNYDAAKKILLVLKAEDPKNQAVMETLAYLEAKEGLLDQAWDDYQAVLAVTEGRESVLFNLVLLGRLLDKKAEAWEYAQRLVALKPAEAAYQRAGGLLVLVLDKSAEAEPLIASYLRAKEKDAVALLSFAEDLAALGYHSRALVILDGIVAADTKNARAYFIQAREYAEGAQDYSKAKAALKQALDAGFNDQNQLSTFIKNLPGERQLEMLDQVKKKLPDFQLSLEKKPDEEAKAAWDPAL